MNPSSPRTGFASVLALAAGFVGVLLWLALLSGPWRLATGLLDATEHFDRAENKLSSQAMKAARYETLAGVAAAARARSGYEQGGPLLEVASVVPTIDKALGQVDHLISAAELTGEAAQGTLDVAQNALRGPNKIIVKDPADDKGGSRIRIDRIEEIAATIRDVRKAIKGVGRELRSVEPLDLPKRARPRIAEGIEKADETDALLADAEEGFSILPGFLGAEGPRTYVFGMQNSAEQRGPGGALLQYGLLTIEDGKPELIDAASTIYAIDKNRQTLDIPLPEDAWYVAAIEDAQRFGNANWSPDWPLSAKVTTDYARASKATFPEPDGVIAVDPVLMKKLMEGVGRFQTDRYDIYMTEERVIHFLLYKAYATYPIPKVRRNHLLDVVDSFYANMLKPKHPTALVEAFGSSLRQKHMQVWMKDPKEQAFMERMNWDGAIEQDMKGDYLYVVEQNVGGNKLDYFTDHTNTVNVQFDGNDAAVTSSVEIENNVFFPQPLYPMGDSGKERETNGFHRPMMNVYVPADARLQLAEVDGRRIDTPVPAVWPAPNQPAEHEERGKKVWSATLEIPPQESGAFTLGYVVPDAVRERQGRKVYRLTVQRQPRVRPERLSVTVALPQGATDVRAKGWKRQGDRLVWDRPLKEDIVLEVSWRS